MVARPTRVLPRTASVRRQTASWRTRRLVDIRDQSGTSGGWCQPEPQARTSRCRVALTGGRLWAAASF
jgi:hypothetical protein